MCVCVCVWVRLWEDMFSRGYDRVNPMRPLPINPSRSRRSQAEGQFGLTLTLSSASG